VNGEGCRGEKDQPNNKVISELSQGIKRGCMRASWTHCGLSSSRKKGQGILSVAQRAGYARFRCTEQMLTMYRVHQLLLSTALL
jgi:hypothetical protein